MPEEQQQPVVSAPAPPKPNTNPPVRPVRAQPPTVVRPTVVHPTTRSTPANPVAPSAIQPAAPARAPAPAATTQSQPLQQPVADSPQQSVAPTGTTPPSPGPQPTMSAPLQDKKTSKRKLFKIIGISVTTLVVLTAISVTAFLLLSGDDGSIAQSDLTSDSYSGVSFDRPEQWLEKDYEEGKAFVLEGQEVDKADQGLLVLTQDIGVDYSQLNEAQQQLLSDGFKDELSKPETLEDDGCKSVADFSANTTTQEGYDVAFLVEATCTEFQDSAQEGRLKYIIGISGSQLHGLSVVGLSELWDTSEEALNTVLRSMAPTL